MSAIDDDLAELGRFVLEMEDWQRDAYLDSLELGEVELVEAAISAAEMEGADWRETPATMAHHLTRGRYRLWRYNRLLGEKFVDAVEGRSKRQIWLLPRRYGKSWMASRWGPTWALDRYPRLNILLASYGDALAVENAIAIRDNLIAHGNELRVRLRADRRKAGRFVTTEGGGVLARGISSSIVGFGADGAIFDDPYKSWQEAHSPARREMVLNAFRSAVYGTLETEDSWIIIPMTCWHESDIGQHLLAVAGADGENEQWELIRLPELAEEPNPYDPKWWLRLPDPLGRKPGEPIEEERYSKASILKKHRGINSSYFVAAMWQQRPAPEEGTEVMRGWFKLFDSPPPRYDQLISSWDMKLKDKEAGDYVVGQAWGRTGSDMWLFDQLRGQWNQATTENAIALMQVRHKIRTHYVENTGYGPEVIANLRKAHPGYQVSDDIAGKLGMSAVERDQVSKLRQRGIPGIVPVPVTTGNKSVRMRAVSGYIEAGNVHIPDLMVAAWTGVYLDEMAAFPNGSHDDQVDATSQALAKLTSGTASIKAAKGDVGKTPISTRGGGTMGVTAAPAPVGTARATVRQRGRLIIPRGVPRSGR